MNTENETQTDDVKAIRALLERLSDAWARGDGTAFGEPFDEDADYIPFNGAYLKGRNAIAEIHQMLFNTALRGTRLGAGAGMPAIRFLRPDVALIHGSGSVQWPGQTASDSAPTSVQTFVVVKRGDHWSIASFQNTRVQPIPGRDAPSGLSD